VKKAAKSYLLNNISASRWTHIMAPKHKWDSVGARSKEQVAELMSRAMAEGRHSAYGSNARMATWLPEWVPALDPGERLQAAAWAAGQYVTAIVHVEGSYGIAARLLLEAQRAAATELATTMRDMAALTHGPDAELMPSVAQRLDGYADQLDAMDFGRW
jgi:hypothetical protein